MKIFRWNFNPMPGCIVDPSLRKASQRTSNLWDKIVIRTWHFFCYWPWQHIHHKWVSYKMRRLEKELFGDRYPKENKDHYIGEER